MVYVDDVDNLFPRAVAAGAKEVRPVADQFYGDRSGTVKDPFGHSWHLSTHKEDVSPEEMKKRMDAMHKKSSYRSAASSGRSQRSASWMSRAARPQSFALSSTDSPALKRSARITVTTPVPARTGRPEGDKRVDHHGPRFVRFSLARERIEPDGQARHIPLDAPEIRRDDLPHERADPLGPG